MRSVNSTHAVAGPSAGQVSGGPMPSTGLRSGYTWDSRMKGNKPRRTTLENPVREKGTGNNADGMLRWLHWSRLRSVSTWKQQHHYRRIAPWWSYITCNQWYDTL
eukprot:581573-Amphidinium_carterae.1